MRCVIYVRVSSERQVRDGHGLEGQETRCRAYAESQGYEVVQVFREEGVGGGNRSRPAMTEFLDFLEDQPDEKLVVVIDDIKRFARDHMVHFELRAEIYKRGGNLESPSYKFGDDPEDHFIELIFSGAAELERRQNAKQVFNRQRARLEAGYWVFYAPSGYKFKADPLHGKVLVRDDPKAAHIAEALEGYASGRFMEQTDVHRFLQSKGFYHRVPKKTVHLSQVKRLLEKSLFYTGHIEMLETDKYEWNISKRKGFHPPLISVGVHERIQEKLSGRGRKYRRADEHPDFPLRGRVVCDGCGSHMTASWVQGRSKKYPYYRCKTKDCTKVRNVLKSDIEGKFEALLERTTPSKDTLRLLEEVSGSIWESKLQERSVASKTRANECKKLERTIDEYAELAGRATSERVRSVYESKIDALERERAAIEGRLEALTEAAPDFKTALSETMRFMGKSLYYLENRLI